MITVMGATGHTGKRITEALLKAGENVRAIGRSESKLADLNRAGAEIMAGDANEPAFLTSAFRGASAVYTLLATDPRSPDYRASQDQQGEAITTAVRESGIRYVVALSSLGADLPSGTGPIVGLRVQEERLRRLADVNVLLLRPSWFFENFEEKLPLIKHQGISGDSLEPDHAFPMVGTRDIADAAARALHARDWSGVVVRELLGPRDISPAEATRLIAQRIGKPDLPYVRFPDSDMIDALVQAGLSRSFAEAYVEMTRALNEDRIKPLAGRTAENTTPTSFEAFAEELALAYRAL